MKSVLAEIEALERKLTASEVAKTILQQLGGNRFIAMTGAKNLIAGDKSLSFKIGRNSKGVNAVRIELESSDTYKVEFMFVSIKARKILSEHSGVYADGLRELFTEQTGMHTSL